MLWTPHGRLRLAPITLLGAVFAMMGTGAAVDPAASSAGRGNAPLLARVSISTADCAEDPNGIWHSISSVGAPEPYADSQGIWTGTEVIIWGGRAASSARYDPARDSWSPMSTVEAPSPRSRADVFWTGSELLVWGGNSLAGGGITNNGARYDPTTDRWTSIPTYPADDVYLMRTEQGSFAVPLQSIWTGSDLIVWSVQYQSNVTTVRIHGRYDLGGRSWTLLGIVHQVDGFRPNRTPTLAVATWTGEEVVFWGVGDGVIRGIRWNPTSEIWSLTNSSGAPPAAYQGNVVAAGNDILAWIRRADGTSIGGVYRPAGDSWRSMNLDGLRGQERRDASYTWSGSEVLVWGGEYRTFPSGAGRSLRRDSASDGMAYDPARDSWRILPDGPGRHKHAAVWTGRQLIVFGGVVGDGRQGAYAAAGGASYTPPCESA
jgi:hypothetical protein